MKNQKDEKELLQLSESELEEVSGGYVVDDGDGKKYWLIRQNGSVISPVPGREMAQEFAKAYSLSTTVLTREEYKKKFGRELVW